MTHFTLTFLGFVLSVLVDISQRNKKSKRTPDKFSFTFFFKDNINRIGVSACISAVIIIMYHVSVFDFETPEYENIFAIAVGFTPDLVIAWLKRKIGFLKD